MLAWLFKKLNIQFNARASKAMSNSEVFKVFWSVLNLKSVTIFKMKFPIKIEGVHEK